MPDNQATGERHAWNRNHSRAPACSVVNSSRSSRSNADIARSIRQARGERPTQRCGRRWRSCWALRAKRVSIFRRPDKCFGRSFGGRRESENEGGGHGSPAAGGGRKLHPLAYGIERIGLIPLRFPLPSLLILVAARDRRRLRRRAHQGRRFAEPALPLRHAGVPAVRGGHRSASRRASSTCWSWSRASRCSSASRSKSSAISSPTCSSSTASAGSSRSSRRASRRRAGSLPAPLFPEELPEGADYDQLIERVQGERDHPRQAPVGGRQLALVVLALEPAIVGGGELNDARQRDPRHDRLRPRRLRADRASSPACRSCSSRSATRSSATG